MPASVEINAPSSLEIRFGASGALRRGNVRVGLDIDFDSGRVLISTAVGCRLQRPPGVDFNRDFRINAVALRLEKKPEIFEQIYQLLFLTHID